jgi:hypothetical protein
MVLAMIMSIFTIIAHASAVVKANCHTDELRAKNCTIKTEKIQLEVKTDHILAFSKLKKPLIIENPFSSQYAEWTDLRITTVGGDNFIEFIAWDMPGSTGQQLVHTIYQIKKNEIKSIAREGVGIRVWNEDSKSYQSTPLSKLTLEVSRSGKIEIYKDKVKIQ